VGAMPFLSILFRCVLHWTDDSMQFFERLTGLLLPLCQACVVFIAC